MIAEAASMIIAGDFDPSTLAVPGGFVGAVAVIVITLIKTRSTDRQDLSKDTNEHMDRLTKERNDAVEAQNSLQESLDGERKLRREAEDKYDAATSKEARLREFIADLEQANDFLRNQLGLNQGSNGGSNAAPRPQPHPNTGASSPGTNSS